MEQRRTARDRMRLRYVRKLFFLTLAFKVFLMSLGAFSVDAQSSASNDLLEPVTVKTDLYPANADANQEIAGALKTAATECKRVMLIFGGNWCYDCHVLDHALHEGEAGKIVKEYFLLVHVDIGEANKNLDLVKKYKTPLEKGVPAVAILGSDGSVLYSSGDGEFEAARRMMKKDLVTFLNRWKGSGD